MKKQLFPVIFLIFLLQFACKEKEGGAGEVNRSVLMAKADSLIIKTFDTLRNTLLKAVGEKGFAGAVSFCNTEALSLTNTFTRDGISLRRTSDKIRNPLNKAHQMEWEVLNEYLQLKKDKKELNPVLKKDAAGNHHYFKPILMQALCLNCHGEKQTQIKPGTWDVLQQNYPSDAAFDYKEGDLRGIWHVVFSKKNS